MIKKALMTGLAAAFTATTAQASPGFYGSAETGINTIEKFKTGAALRGSFGYLFGESKFNYGLEFGITDYPKNTYKSNTYGYSEIYSGHYIDLLGVGKYNFNDDETGFFVTGKAGAAAISQKVIVKGSSSSNYQKSMRGIRPEFAVGAGYNINKNLSVDVTFAHVFGSKVDPNTNPAGSLTKVNASNTLMAGLTYKF